jgi:plasmid maintenance system antidote protein VapI
VGDAVDTTVKAFEVADADNLKNLRTAASAAAGQLGFISQARDQVQNIAVAGTGVPTVVRGLNAFLAPLGINADQVAKTRNLEQALNSIIAQGIKQYGANPSTADLEFAKRASASITDPKQAIAETLNYLEERANSLVNKSTAADAYLLRNKNLGGFEKFWLNQQKNNNNPPTQSGVRKTKSGVSYTVVPQN